MGKVWTKQSPAGTQILKVDHSNPLAANLAAAWYMQGAAGHVIDALANRTPLEVTGLNPPIITPGITGRLVYDQTATGATEASADHGRFRKASVSGNSPLGFADSNACTILARVRIHSYATTLGRLVDKGLYGDGQDGYAAYYGASGNLSFTVDGTANCISSNTGVIAFDDTSHLISIRYHESISALRSLRINGVEELLSSLSVDFPTATADLAIGNWNRTDTTTSRRFNGEIDYVLMFDAILPDHQVAALEADAYQILVSKPRFALADVPTDVRHVKMPRVWTRQPPPGTAFDPRIELLLSPANGLTSEPARNRGITNSGAVLDVGVGGVAGKFADATDYIDYSNYSNFGAAKVTYVCVFEVSDLSHSNYLLSNRTPSTFHNSEMLSVSTSGAFKVLYYGTVAYRINLSSAVGIIQTDKLYTAVISIDGAAGEGSVAINGTNLGVTNTGDSSALEIVDTGTVWMGNDNRDPNLNFDGKMYLFARLNGALSDAEITSISGNPWQVFKPSEVIVPINESLPDVGIFERSW